MNFLCIKAFLKEMSVNILRLIKYIFWKEMQNYYFLKLKGKLTLKYYFKIQFYSQ